LDTNPRVGEPPIRIDEENSPWRRHNRTVVYENDWITVYHDDVRRPDGNPGIYGVVHYRNRAVGIVAIDHRDRLLLVGQFRYTIGKYSWEIPAGGCPAGEEPIETARRELKEETGYTAKSLRLLVVAHLSNSVSDEKAFCYLAEDLTPGQPAPEVTEQLQVQWEDFASVLHRIERQEITDALTILAVQQTALMRLANQGV